MFYLMIVLGMAFFALTTYGAIFFSKRLCKNIEPFGDGPAPAEPPVRLMYALAVVVGASLGYHQVAPAFLAYVAMAYAAILNGFLIAAWYCDTRCGIIPDWITLTPLAVTLIYDIATKNVVAVVIALLMFGVFGIQAWRSKGLGMGWGDAKLVAFAGAFIGVSALFSTMLACIAMLVYAKFTKRMNEPVAFAPFLVCGFELALLASTGVVG